MHCDRCGEEIENGDQWFETNTGEILCWACERDVDEDDIADEF